MWTAAALQHLLTGLFILGSVLAALLLFLLVVVIGAVAVILWWRRRYWRLDDADREPPIGDASVYGRKEFTAPPRREPREPEPMGA